MSLDFEIENVGGIERADLHLAPGVNVLRGLNGTGKTCAMQAVSRAQGGDTPLERRDGSAHGEVRGPGVRLRIGKVVSTTGHAELALADIGPLAKLIEPGLKDTDAAARARVRALVELLGLGVDDESIADLCDGEPELLGWLQSEVQETATSDLLAAAELLRGRAHSLARQHEGRLTEAEGAANAARERATAILEEIGGESNLVDLSPQGARQGLIEGTQAYERAVTECEARETLETRQAKIRETVGERPDHEAAQAIVLGLAGDKAGLDAEVDRLQGALATAKERQAAKAAEVTAQEQRAGDVRDAADRWDTQRAVLDQPAEGPTREEVEAIRCKRVVEAESVVEAAERSQSVRQSQEDAAEGDREKAKAYRAARDLRSFASSLPERLGRILARSGAAGLTVVGGRLAAIDGGGTLDFERRLSEGQRVRRALEVAAPVYRDAVLPLEGVYWNALDPVSQREFSSIATELGLYVLTESPADGDLRVEHVAV